MEDLAQQFEQHWKQHKFPAKNVGILLALSGGKDSMALAFLLKQLGYSFAIAHCNFQLRGDDSLQDEAHVLAWAQKNNITCHHIRFDTQTSITEFKMGLQETARKLRYDWFAQLCNEHHYAAIATAHHANDNAETLLINLCKGTGIAGMHGIPVHNKNIIRPLLFASRIDIDTFVQEHQIPFREDASNASNKYLRNAVRHQVIPVLNELFSNAVEKINESIHRLQQVEAIYLAAIEQEKKKLIEQRGTDFYLSIPLLKKRIAWESICYEICSKYGFSAQQNTAIIKLLDSSSGHYIDSPTHRILRDRQFLIITTKSEIKSEHLLIDQIPCQIETEEGKFSFSVIDATAINNINDTHTAFVDTTCIKLPLLLRKWRTGDYFYPLGMGMKKKKISRYFIDQKMPLHHKDKIWIIEQDKQIVWLAGYRLDERCKIKPSSKQALRIAFTPNK
jgi:tRNA(Ile)-lysidine synthase